METPRELADGIAALVSQPNGPCGTESIRATEDRLYVRLPDDVREFFARMNGTSDMTDVTHGLITLWPLEQWGRWEGESGLARGPLAGAVAFADHSISCWVYAARFERHDPDTMRIWIVGGPEPILVGETFSQFAKMILSGDDTLYGKLANKALNPTGLRPAG